MEPLDTQNTNCADPLEDLAPQATANLSAGTFTQKDGPGGPAVSFPRERHAQTGELLRLGLNSMPNDLVTQRYLAGLSKLTVVCGDVPFETWLMKRSADLFGSSTFNI